MGKYDDILNYPLKPVLKHVRMSEANRASQFAPFAALVGYDALVEETARITDEEIVLDDNLLISLDETLLKLRENIKAEPLIKVLYFEKDERKSGGRYLSLTSHLRRLDESERVLIFKDGTKLKLSSILKLELV